ncbi:AhpC/TSA family protein [Bacteroides sp. 214]|uniref:TlpA disulfide reductase family protein n=1 Tax=Bacteroides sp. 214 TaxID=2302935 RepID=UPI0013D5D1ED|nr:TlpA disulfide reductase family protein [Bacteroides sp. 214]NDW11330.1 AhpC/TSA family protein [Bacteroides sp. 214]
MKKWLSLLAGMALVITSCQEKTYKITGTVEGGLFGEKVYLMERTEDGFLSLDSTVIDTQEAFTFEGVQDSAVMLFLTYTDGEQDPFFADFVLENGKIKARLSHDEKRTSVTGTPLNNSFQTFKQKRQEYSQQLMEIFAAMRASQDKEKEKKEMEALEEMMTAELYTTIQSNTHNVLGAYLLGFFRNYLDYAQIKAALINIPATYKTDPILVKLQQRVDAADVTATGNKFVDFEMFNEQGDVVCLSDFVGKSNYVLVDFWASWCNPCLREMPKLVELYATYKNKGLQVVGVSLDNDKQAWLACIKKMSMAWVQMSDLKGWSSEGAELYGIRSIPHMLIIDQEGTIIARDLTGENLANKLKELFD